MEAASPCQSVALADVVAAQGGDETAFTRLVESTCKLVSSIALAIARDPDVSRDIAQDVFLSAWHDIRKLREPSSFLPWLRQITRNRAHHVMRTSRRRRRRVETQEIGELFEAVVDPRPDAGQQLVADERRRAIAEAIALLPEETREVITLFYREGQSVAQVASLLDLSEAAVRQRLSRARLRLRDNLLDRLGHDLVDTAPGTAFVAGVAAALSVAAPAAASAATLGAAGVKGIGPLAKLAVLFSGTTVGAAGGALGVVLGVRHFERTAYDEQERQQLRRVKLVGILVSIAGAVGLTAALRLTRSATVSIVAFGVFVAIVMGLYEIWLPRVLRRRRDAEMQADPIRAIRSRRRERIQKVVAWIVAVLGGGAAMWLGLQ